MFLILSLFDEMPVWVMASFPVCSHARVNKYLLSTYCTVGPHHRGGGHPYCPWAVSCSVPATECLLDGRRGCGSWRTSVSLCMHPACRSASYTQKHLGGALCSAAVWQAVGLALFSSPQLSWEDSHAWSLPLSCSSLLISVASSCMAATTCCVDLSVLTAALCLQRCPFFSPNPSGSSLAVTVLLLWLFILYKWSQKRVLVQVLYLERFGLFFFFCHSRYWQRC